MYRYLDIIISVNFNYYNSYVKVSLIKSNNPHVKINYVSSSYIDSKTIYNLIHN